jgi:AcrR family transcriptional regulator
LEVVAKKIKSKPVRVGREEASERLVQAVISLLDTTPMNELLVDLITERAGLASGHVLVHRYFGSRLDLLSEVAHNLARQMIDGLRVNVETKNSNLADPQLFLTVFGPYIGIFQKRALVVSELVLHGFSPEIHSADMKEILNAVQAIMELREIPPRAARATALNVLTLITMETTHSGWMGATQADRDDLRSMTFIEIGLASQVSEMLGWK